MCLTFYSQKNSLCDMRLLIGNCAVVRDGSRLLLEELLTRLRSWSPSQLVGDVFTRLSPAFGLVTYYSQNLDSAIKLLRWLMSRTEAKQVISEVAVRTGSDLR